MSVNAKNKRKLVYNEQLFYWFVRKNVDGIPRLHIISDDKKVNLERPLFDTEVPVVRNYVVKQLDDYFNK